MHRTNRVLIASALHAPFWFLMLSEAGSVAWICFLLAAALVLILYVRRTTAAAPDSSPPVSVRRSCILNAALLVLAAIVRSPTPAAAGVIIWLYPWLRSRSDRAVISGLHYLCLLPVSILFFGIPVTWLQQGALLWGRRLLDQTGHLYFLSAEHLQVPSAAVSLADLTAGWSGPRVFLVACSAVPVLLRLRLLQLLPLIAGAAILSVFRGGLTLLLTAEILQLGGTAGWASPAAASLSFFAAATLYFSLIALVLVLTEPIPLDPYQLNLIAVVWNRCFLILPRTKESAEPIPPFKELLGATDQSGQIFFRWLKEFTATWFFSRSRIRLAAAVPVVAVAVLLSGWGPPDRELLAQTYSDRVDQALGSEQLDEASWLADRMLELNPTALKSRFQVGQKLLAAGRTAEAIEKIQQVTQLDRKGHPPARIWLVEQAGKKSPAIPLSPARQIRQLQKAIAEDSSDIQPFVLLARLQEQQKQWHLARAAWKDAVQVDLTWLPELVRVQKLLGDDLTEIQREIRPLLQELDRQINDNLHDARLQATRVRVLYLLDQPERAMALLQSAMKSTNDDELAQLMASARVRDALQLARQPLKRQAALQAAIHALQFDPSQTLALELLGVELPEGPFQTQPLQTALQYWQTERNKQPNAIEPRLRTGQLFMLLGQPAAAIAVLKDNEADSPSLRWSLAQAYLQAGQRGQAEPLLQSLQNELLPAVESANVNSADPSAALNQYLQILLLRQQYEQVIHLVERRHSDWTSAPRAETDRYVAAVLALVRQQTDDEKRTVSGDSVGLLIRAHQAQPQHSEILHRLAQTSYQQDEAGRRAEQFLRKQIAAGRHLFALFSTLGATAILQEDYPAAVDALEKALRFSPQNAVTKNNLAVALVRTSPPDGDRALHLIDEALQEAPDFPELIATRGEILLQLGRTWEARQELTRVLQMDADHKLARTLLQEVQSKEGP